VLTKDCLVKKSWQGNTSCVFCNQYEDIDHLFVSCKLAKALWNWIAFHNGFHFTGQTLEDLWMLDCCIPLKDHSLVELVRSVVCWILWLERNNVIFRSAKRSSLRSLGLKVINLATFWCTARKIQILKLTLILPQRVDTLPLQAEE
jgi:zinc-binding in reverse transcriptase